MAKKAQTGKGKLFGFDPSASWLKGGGEKSKDADKGNAGRIVFLGKKADQAAVLKKYAKNAHIWEVEWVSSDGQQPLPIKVLSTDEGPLWLVSPYSEPKPPMTSHGGLLASSPYGKARDLVGNVVGLSERYTLKRLEIIFEKAEEREVLGGLVGVELSSYRYKVVRGQVIKPRPKLILTGIKDQVIEEAATIGTAINISRHLVNLPAGELNPSTYADAVEALFSSAKHTQVEIWNWERLKKEKMGLHMSVGQGAKDKPCLVHIRYRPKAKGAPIAFVGKGITFDTGGLDLKNAAGMRLMKKDMGGSAALVGLAYWLTTTELSQPCDFYLALAENSVSAESFHPGDVITARNGQTVEIHNTDAEGRLVLGDALNVALSQKDKDAPSSVINVATLTGAIKVALGTDLFGLFVNDDKLAEGLQEAAVDYGDRGWRMPLYSDYEAFLQSQVADVANASNSPFAGAVTAALFLQRFVENKPWAHLDIYAWNDSPKGSILEPGGNGQAVQCLIGFLSSASS